MKSLPEAELNEELLELPKWHLAEGRLVRDYDFPGFNEAMTFVTRIAKLAEEQDHHPDIDIRYNRVRLGLVTHDAHGITRRDLRLAALIDRLAG